MLKQEFTPGNYYSDKAENKTIFKFLYRVNTDLLFEIIGKNKGNYYNTNGVVIFSILLAEEFEDICKSKVINKKKSYRKATLSTIKTLDIHPDYTTFKERCLIKILKFIVRIVLKK